MEGSVGEKEEVFYRSVNATTLKLEKTAVSFVQLGLRQELIKTESMSYSIRGGYRIRPPFSTDYYHARLGRGYYIGLVAEHKFGIVTFIGEANYQHDTFPVRTIQFQRTEIGFSLGLRFSFGASAGSDP